MKTLLTVVTLTIAAVSLAVPAAAQEHAMQPSKGFEQLKPLIGERKLAELDDVPQLGQLSLDLVLVRDLQFVEGG